MSRRMSVALTLDAVRARTKTVTRRNVATWRTLKTGDTLTLIEKGMGLPKGTRQVVVAEVEIVDVRVEALSRMTYADIRAEGFDIRLWTPSSWCEWWLLEHGYRRGQDPDVRRIEWRYLSPEDGAR